MNLESDICSKYCASGMIMMLAHCTLRPRQNGRRFVDDTFIRIFLNENVWISIKVSLKFVPKGPINNTPALVQIMAWRRPGDKPLSEPMMVSLLTHICVTRPQWVNWLPSFSHIPLNRNKTYEISFKFCENMSLRVTNYNKQLFSTNCFFNPWQNISRCIKDRMTLTSTVEPPIGRFYTWRDTVE